MSRIPRTTRVLASVLLAAGLLALGYAAYVFIDAKAYQASERRGFEAARRDLAAHDAAPPEAAAPPPALLVGGSIGEIRLARLGLTAMIVEGDSAPILRRAVGHLAGTALPGEPGNVVLAGHRDTFFRPLRHVRVGDAITLTTLTGVFEYLVESTAVVPPSDLQVLEPTGGRTLTLITCFPFASVGPAPDRFIVRARETPRG